MGGAAGSGACGELYSKIMEFVPLQRVCESHCERIENGVGRGRLVSLLEFWEKRDRGGSTIVGVQPASRKRYGQREVGETIYQDGKEEDLKSTFLRHLES